MTLDTQQPDNDIMVNAFARFFGALLVELQHRNLRLRHEPLSLAASEASRVEFSRHIR